MAHSKFSVTVTITVLSRTSLPGFLVSPLECVVPTLCGWLPGTRSRCRYKSARSHQSNDMVYPARKELRDALEPAFRGLVGLSSGRVHSGTCAGLSAELLTATLRCCSPQVDPHQVAHRVHRTKLPEVFPVTETASCSICLLRVPILSLDTRSRFFHTCSTRLMLAMMCCKARTSSTSRPKQNRAPDRTSPGL